MKKKIVSLSVLPVLVLGVIVIWIALFIVRGALVREIKDALKSAATATFAAYDQNAGEYLQASNGDIWKGSYNISKSESIVDSIRDKSGMEVTFFYGDRRVMTSAKDKDGNRILGSPAGTTIKKQVLEQGKDYFSRFVSIDGTMYYGYYIPVCQEGSDTPVGMIFVGTNKADKDASINRIVYVIIAVAAGIMLICIVFALLLSKSMTDSLKKGINTVQSVAKGNLKTEVDRKLLQRKDEIGDMSRSVAMLREEMARSIESIARNAEAVFTASGSLDSTAKQTTQSMNEVENAVNSIAQSASLQADISGKASDHVNSMGHKIEQTSKEMAQMKKNAKAMQESEQENAQTIHKLLESNEQVQELVEQIAKQTRQTNESAKKIKEASETIVAIAEETSLLSLNAGIEAARAGENGKGFAVVADQIQKLANLTNASSGRIEQVISTLLEDSNRAVEIMDKVADTMENQTNRMQETKTATDDVMFRLKESLDSLNHIETSVAYLDNARQEIVKTVEELSDIAKQNAATTQEVSSNTNIVSDSFRKVGDSTQNLRSIAEGLEESMQHFHM